jgi:UDP-glucose 4-epimerase
VLEYLRTAVPHGRLVIPSSAAVYGVANKTPIALQSPLQPVSPYGVHKKIVEELCSSYAKHFGLQVALIRFFSLYGISLRKQLLWDACTKMQAGNFSFMGTGLETRDLLHVEDAVQLVLKALESASSGCPIVNGGRGEAVEIRAILKAVALALGTQRNPSFSGVERVGDPLHYQADTTEALNLGWKPSRDWRSEIAAYVAWFKAGAP